MNILLLGEKSSLILDKIHSLGHDTFVTCGKISADMVKGYEYIISFGYRYIITEDIINMFPDKIINLHISYLPYNKGSDPNLWSYLEDTPKGVTIHYIDKGIDSGRIILQKKVVDADNDTLKTSYDRLINEIVLLFNNNISNLLHNNIKPVKQTAKGSIHYFKDKEKYLFLLEKKGYDTLVKDIKGKAVIHKNKGS